jgi:hypothetical protein
MAVIPYRIRGLLEFCCIPTTEESVSRPVPSLHAHNMGKTGQTVSGAVFTAWAQCARLVKTRAPTSSSHVHNRSECETAMFGLPSGITKTCQG